jgi:hypothetical protein
MSTSALDGGEWSALRPGRVLASGKGPPVPIVQEAGWAPEPVWTQRLEEKSFCLCLWSNLHSPVVQSLARHCTDWATRLIYIHIDKCRYEIQEQKEVPVCYTGPFRALLVITSAVSLWAYLMLHWISGCYSAVRNRRDMWIARTGIPPINTRPEQQRYLPEIRSRLLLRHRRP